VLDLSKLGKSALLKWKKAKNPNKQIVEDL